MEQQYTTLTKDINNIDNKDAIVYAYIKSRMNYKTSIADNVTFLSLVTYLRKLEI